MTRQWELTDLDKKIRKSGLEFTIMTYNILSQIALENHMNWYKKCNPKHFDEEHRVSKILREILRSNSDIICLQEVEEYVYDQWITQVFESHGYGSVFKKRTGNRSDGCAILWRKAKFSLVKHHEIEYKRRNWYVLDRDHIGLIAVFKPCHLQASQTELHVATTHLIFNPRRGDVKFCQLRLLLAELERSALKEVSKNERVYHPTILCGDLNFEPHSPLYRFVETGRIDITQIVSGDMSGQRISKNQGWYLEASELSMTRLGIDKYGRFCDNNTSVIQEPSASRESVTGVDSQNIGESSRDSRLESYGFYDSNMTVFTQMCLENSSKKASSPAVDEGYPSSCSSSDYISNSDSSSNVFYHGFNFESAYKFREGSKQYPVSCMIGGEYNTLDHIFYSVQERSPVPVVKDQLKLLGSYSLPCVDQLPDGEVLPNAYSGSDHLSLISKFVITFNEKF